MPQAGAATAAAGARPANPHRYHSPPAAPPSACPAPSPEQSPCAPPWRSAAGAAPVAAGRWRTALGCGPSLCMCASSGPKRRRPTCAKVSGVLSSAAWRCRCATSCCSSNWCCRVSGTCGAWSAWRAGVRHGCLESGEFAAATASAHQPHLEPAQQPVKHPQRQRDEQRDCRQLGGCQGPRPEQCHANPMQGRHCERGRNGEEAWLAAPAAAERRQRAEAVGLSAVRRMQCANRASPRAALVAVPARRMGGYLLLRAGQRAEMTESDSRTDSSVEGGDTRSQGPWQPAQASRQRRRQRVERGCWRGCWQ